MYSMTNLFTYTATQPPTNVRATVLTPRSVEVTWSVSSSSDVIGYLISYTTNASYTSGDSVTVNGRSTTSHTLSNLEEDTIPIPSLYELIVIMEMLTVLQCQ